MTQENLPVVHVINGRQKKLLQGHPWVYGNEIERVATVTVVLPPAHNGCPQRTIAAMFSSSASLL